MASRKYLRSAAAALMVAATLGGCVSVPGCLNPNACSALELQAQDEARAHNAAATAAGAAALGAALGAAAGAALTAPVYVAPAPVVVVPRPVYVAPIYVRPYRWR